MFKRASSFFVIVSKVSPTSRVDHQTSGRPFASFFLQAAASLVATESSIFSLLAIVADPDAPIAFATARWRSAYTCLTSPGFWLRTLIQDLFTEAVYSLLDARTPIVEKQ